MAQPWHHIISITSDKGCCYKFSKTVDKHRNIVYYLTMSLVRNCSKRRDGMEYNPNAPIYMQVIRELKKLMIQGELKPGQKMPSNRDLAVLFKVN